MTEVIDEQQLVEIIALDKAGLIAIEQGFTKLAQGQVRLPPIMGLEIPENNGAADVKTAYVRGWESFAIKASTRFFDNPGRGLPSGSGFMALLNSETGQPQAIFLDNGYLTTVRTALAGALAAKILAPERVDTVAVFGAGSQAHWQLRALRLVRDFKHVHIVARNSQRATALASELRAEFGIQAQASEDPAAALASAQIAITTTPATQPILYADWLHPGLHITAMGADAEHKNEIDPAVWSNADVKVCDEPGQCETRGELRHAIAAGSVADRHGVVALGDIIVGNASGRCTQDQISICDLTGVGVQDTAIAQLAWQRLARATP